MGQLWAGPYAARMAARMAARRTPGPPRADGYASFVIRWRRLPSEVERIEVEHIQSGRRTLADSPASALDWMERLLGESALERGDHLARESQPGQRVGPERVG